jgi:nitrous oxidase accessory protein
MVSLRQITVLLFCICLFASYLLPVIPVNAASRTIVVPNDYAVIQEAVNNAAIGDKLLVKAGLYHQNVSIDKPLSLIGEDPKTTVLAGKYGSNIFDPSVTIQISADNVEVSGFTIKRNMEGINAKGDNIKITSNYLETSISLTGSFGTVVDNNLNSTQGLSLSIDGKNNTVSNNSITGYLNLKGSSNQLDNNFVSIIATEKACLNTISKNIVENLRLRSNSSANIVSENIIAGEYLYGIQVADGRNNIFFDNNVTNLTYGGHRNGVSLIGHTENNTFYHNNFFNNNQGVYLSLNAPSANFWDNGKEGNYWEDYRTSKTLRAWNDYNVSDTNRDGTNDTPYIINEQNVDHYPLTSPYNTENSQSPATQETFSFALYFSVIAAILLLVIAFLLFYRRKWLSKKLVR